MFMPLLMSVTIQPHTVAIASLVSAVAATSRHSYHGNSSAGFNYSSDVANLTDYDVASQCVNNGNDEEIVERERHVHWFQDPAIEPDVETRFLNEVTAWAMLQPNPHALDEIRSLTFDPNANLDIFAWEAFDTYYDIRDLRTIAKMRRFRKIQRIRNAQTCAAAASAPPARNPDYDDDDDNDPNTFEGGGGSCGTGVAPLFAPLLLGMMQW